MTDQATFPSGPRERATLSRDLADFLIEFSIAINKYSMYPGGHPSLRPAAERVINRLGVLLSDRSTLSLGVARQQLVIEGVATDPKNPVLSDLAGRLHRHQLGAITFRQGLDAAELQDVLVDMSQEADRLPRPLGAESVETLSRWRSIRLYPVNYERLEIVGEGHEDDEDGGGGEGDAKTRAAQLWVGLARAAMAVDEADAANVPDDEHLHDPAAVARAIAEHKSTSAYDQVIVGYMLQIADELRSGTQRESAELKRRMSGLVSSLDKGTMQRLLTMGGDRVQRRRFLLDASQGMSMDAVVELVQAAATADEQTISHSLLRMLQKLAQHSERSTGQRRTVAAENTRAQIAQLVRNWSLKDPNPDAYRAALERMAGTESLLRVSPEARYRPEPRRLIQMALEVNTIGDQVVAAVEALIANNEWPWLLETLTTAPANGPTEALWRMLGEPERVRALAATEPLDVVALDRIVAKIGIDAAPPLFDVLAESESAQTRRVLVDRLAKMGPALVTQLTERLSDERWFVVRNLLGIMSAWPEFPEGFDGRTFLKHADPRVRREGMKVMLKLASGRERTISQALTDQDSRMVEIGLTVALDGCPESVVPLVVARATSDANEALRALAIKVLAASETAMAREALIGMATPRRSLFGTKLPPKTAALVATVAALRNFGDDPRARTILDLARRSKDQDLIRAAGDSQ